MIVGLVWLFGCLCKFAVSFAFCAFHQDKQCLLVDMWNVGAIYGDECRIEFGAGWKWECLLHVWSVALLLATTQSSIGHLFAKKIFYRIENKSNI